jgi:hypothetical protein
VTEAENMQILQNYEFANRKITGARLLSRSAVWINFTGIPYTIIHTIAALSLLVFKQSSHYLPLEIAPINLLY